MDFGSDLFTHMAIIIQHSAARFLSISSHRAAVVMPPNQALAEARQAKHHMNNITAVSAHFVRQPTKFARHCMLVWTGPRERH